MKILVTCSVWEADVLPLNYARKPRIQGHLSGLSANRKRTDQERRARRPSEARWLRRRRTSLRRDCGRAREVAPVRIAHFPTSAQVSSTAGACDGCFGARGRRSRSRSPRRATGIGRAAPQRGMWIALRKGGMGGTIYARRPESRHQRRTRCGGWRACRDTLDIKLPLDG